MAPPLLQLTGIRKAFGAVQALKGVSFALAAGEVHALVGENGAGKSTLVKLISGALNPDEGTIAIAGQVVERLEPSDAQRLGIGCIYQQPVLFPELSVAENIGFRLERTTGSSWINWKARQERARKELEGIGATIPPGKVVRELSMAERQLVEIACVVGSGARIVIMDEPTASLTQKEQHLLFRVVRELRGRGVGVVYISHRLEEVFALADTVTVLRDGESVGTHAASSLTEANLISLMIGRQVAQLYPPKGAERGKCVLSVKELSCTSSGVRNISFELHAGEVLGMAGLVGAGRTELARVLFGITPADAGEILIEDRRVLVTSPQQAVDLGIGFVPEDRTRHGVILELPISQNVSMAIHSRLFPGGWLRFDAEQRLAREFLQRLDIRAPGIETLVCSLSGGNQQKVALGRWLASEPKILILDEPTQGVDIGAKAEIHGLIRKLAAQGMAVLLISSDLPEVLGMSDRVAVMRKGQLVTILPGTAEPHQVMSVAFGQKGSEA